MTFSVLLNRAKMSVTGAPGTGDITLNAAVTGFQTFDAAATELGAVIDGKLLSYVAEDTGGNREYGQGTYTASTKKLARTTIISNSGSAISLTSATVVSVMALVEDLKAGHGEPSGRITLASATPVMTSSQTGKTTVYFTPYQGNQVPVWNGRNWIWTEFSELSQETTDTTKSPAAVAASSIYDLFVWSDSGTLRCTRGPAWSSTTSRGTGAGTTELQTVNGYDCNKNAITNGPAAGYGLYVGSIASNASSQIDWAFGGTGSGGSAGWFGVWNKYNRKEVTSISCDNTTSYTYGTATWRAMNNSNANRHTFLQGLSEDVCEASLRTCSVPGAGVVNYFAIALDSTTTPGAGASTQDQVSAASQTFTAMREDWVGIGLHYYQAIEMASGGTFTNYPGPASNNSVQSESLTTSFWA